MSYFKYLLLYYMDIEIFIKDRNILLEEEKILNMNISRMSKFTEEEQKEFYIILWKNKSKLYLINRKISIINSKLNI